MEPNKTTTGETTTMETTTTGTTTTGTTTLPPQELATDSPPSYYPQPSPPVQPPVAEPAPTAQPTQQTTTTTEHQEITTAPNGAETTTTTTHTETFAPVNEKGALQAPQPALIQPMTPAGAKLGQNPVPPGANPLDYPVPIETLRDTPRAVDCPYCKRRSMTALNLESGNTVVAWSIALCCLLGLCCAWIPCVMDSCKDTIHYCSQCRNQLVTITNSGKVKVRETVVATANEKAG